MEKQCVLITDSLRIEFITSSQTTTGLAEAKKDPGIPSMFPYKDRILEEVQQTRRRVRYSLTLIPAKPPCL